MKQSCILLLTVLGFALLTMGFHCYRDYPPIKPTYEFIEKLSLTPYKKTYAVGDTIWVQFQTTDKSLFDKLSGNRIPTDTTYFQVNFNFQKRYPIPYTVELFSDTKVDSALDVSFTPLSNLYNTLNFKTACSSNRYFFRVGFIPKKTGVFSIEPHGIFISCPNKLNLPYSTFKFTFDLADCNKDVWLSIPAQSRGGELGFTDVRIDQKEIFVLKVE